MKHICVFILMLTVFVLKAQGQMNSSSVISFSEELHDFGDVKQGDTLQYTFEFKNTGSSPLIISEVVTPGVIKATWSTDPIGVGKAKEMPILFIVKGKPGMQNKVITILSNATNSPVKLSIKANVLPKN
ncbi:MAG TPA: DUF1573 domain-containing protein [Cytophagaceae bacterium]|jgi:hypothetical protein|nr:DUF1573 domain-containing protein [Cytophagaceae bacterium]